MNQTDCYLGKYLQWKYEVKYLLPNELLSYAETL